MHELTEFESSIQLSIDGEPICSGEVSFDHMLPAGKDFQNLIQKPWIKGQISVRETNLHRTQQQNATSRFAGRIASPKFPETGIQPVTLPLKVNAQTQ